MLDMHLGQSVVAAKDNAEHAALCTMHVQCVYQPILVASVHNWPNWLETCLPTHVQNSSKQVKTGIYLAYSSQAQRHGLCPSCRDACIWHMSCSFMSISADKICK